MFGEIQIIESKFMSEYIETPIKKHKGNEKTNYSKRVQKKWNKRYGVENKLHFITDGKVIYCNPANKLRLIQSV